MTGHIAIGHLGVGETLGDGQQQAEPDFRSIVQQNPQVRALSLKTGHFWYAKNQECTLIFLAPFPFVFAVFPQTVPQPRARENSKMRR